MKTKESNIALGGPYHWTHNANGRLSLHKGTADKCRRVHRDERGNR